MAKYRLTVFIEKTGDFASRSGAEIASGEYETDEAAIAAFTEVVQERRRNYRRLGYESYFTVRDDSLGSFGSSSREVAHL